METSINPDGTSRRENPAVPIVCIGASAGGLDAFNELISNLPEQSGMAFVLIQHLEPMHESHLAGILSKSTSMQVAEAKDGMVVVPNQVYVIPPNTNMVLAQGTLCLSPRNETRGVHLPIDYFMGSMAEDKHRLSIGVVLSGTGSDGTRGLAEIKAAGGITFAQDETSAKYPAMPLSAVAAGNVDIVLPPSEIALELGRIGNHPYLTHPNTEEAGHPFTGCEEEYARIIALLRSSSDVDFTYYRDSTLKRRILRRMALVNRKTLHAYLECLESDAAEIKTLCEDILIHFTRFFRDGKVFEAISDLVLPVIQTSKSQRDTIRIWVAGCATGEEAYSLAIVLCEFQDTQETRYDLRIFASDISESPALEKARVGFYPESLAHDVTPERLRRFFVKVKDGYRINKVIREMCVFAKHDMTVDPPFAKLDLISCRNVLTYLTAPLQKQLIQACHYALNPGGFLVLGNTETIGTDTDLFSAVDSDLKIYSKQMKAISSPNPAPKATTGDPGKSKSVPFKPSPLDFQQAADRLLLRKFVPPGVLVNKDMDILQFRGRTTPFLEPPIGGTGFNLAKMSKETLSQELRSAIRECGERGVPVLRKDVRILDGRQIHRVNLEVLPIGLPEASEVCYLVLFEAEDAPGAHSPIAMFRNQMEPHENEENSLLRLELAAASEYLQSVREQNDADNEGHKSLNEEMESSNEELQSTNEELQTAKEELQTANEELESRNDELRTRNIELAQLNDDLNNLLGSVQIPIIMLGSDLRIRRFTPSAGKAMHLAGTDIGRPIANVKFAIPDFDLVGCVSDVIASQSPAMLEMHDKDGRWHALKIHPYRSSENKVDGAVVVLLDIDEVKRAQQRLQESGDFARSIVDTVREPLVILEKDLRIHSANLSYYQLFGTLPQNTEGKVLQEVDDGLWQNPEILAFLENKLNSGKGFMIDNFEVSHDLQGKHSTLVLNARQLLHYDGRGERTLLAIDDITDRRKTEKDLHQSQERLRESQRMEAIGKLAGGVAHDFNNLLTAINGYSALCLDEVPADGNLHGYLEEIARAGERAASLTGQLLAYSRKQVLIAKVMDLNSIISQLHNMLSRLIGEHIQIVLSLSDSLGKVKADPGQIEQVLINLVVNARDALLPRGGEIYLRTTNEDWEGYEEGNEKEEGAGKPPKTLPLVPRGSYVVLTVSDSGIGMDADLQQRIFDPFFTTKPAGKGPGLGLSVVQGIVSQSEGYITVESEPGVGSVFKVFLPREKSQLIPMARNDGPEVLTAKGTETVLLVEDETTVRNFTRKILEMHGYTVLEADNGQNALLISDQHPDLHINILLTDMIMPGIGGRELADQFITRRPESRVLFMSGYTENAVFHKNGMLEMDVQFLQKPFSPVALAKAVRMALDITSIHPDR